MTSTREPDPPPVLQMRGISKRYPGARALTDANLEVRRGEVHVVVGENGAGKSTLMKILSGAVRADAGEVVLDGSRVELDSPLRARRLGISTIYQELSLVPHMTVAENIFLGKTTTRWPGIVDSRRVGQEPPSARSQREGEQLVATIARVTSNGVAVIYISHRMDEVFRVGHRVT